MLEIRRSIKKLNYIVNQVNIEGIETNCLDKNFYFLKFKNEFYNTITSLIKYFSHKNFNQDFINDLFDELRINRKKRHMHSINLYLNLIEKSELNNPYITEKIKSLFDDVIYFKFCILNY